MFDRPPSCSRFIPFTTSSRKLDGKTGTELCLTNKENNCDSNSSCSSDRNDVNVSLKASVLVTRREVDDE